MQRFSIDCSRSIRLLVLAGFGVLVGGIAMAAPKPAKPDSASIEFFEKKIRPILTTHCYECHAGSSSKGGLALDSKAGLFTGGQHGPAVIAGKPAESLLLKAIAHDGRQMPLKKDKLPDQAIADITEWITRGAVMPDAPAKVVLGKSVDIDAGRAFRSFQPLGKFDPPAVKNVAVVRNPIDRFVQAKLEANGLAPAPMATREQLVRRAYFDVVGLPPTPAQIDEFLNDASADAWEKLIDRLLASEQFGERWARHWLDVARYAESGGYEFDKERPGSYHYRDFVIRAFNRDMPYTDFVKLQLAGDVIRHEDPDALAATGFLASAAFPGQTTAKTIEIIRYDHLDDLISTTSSAFLGLTLACARCHEHKYDPIPQTDYYRLAAALKNLKVGPVKAMGPDGKETTIHSVSSKSGDASATNQTGATISTTAEVHFLIRGEIGRKNGVAAPGYMQVLSTGPDDRWLTGDVNPRVALGNWLTDVDHGAGRLLARVIINRLWQHHFGEGLVGTPNDFGSQGDVPSHPEMLDFLAGELIKGGWKLKPIHKLMMASAVYQRGGASTETNLKADPENKLLWRRAPERLEAEVMRDALLAVGGNIDLAMFGPSVPVPGSSAVPMKKKDTPAEVKSSPNRRGIYLQVKRSKQDALLALFDAPDASQSLGERPETTVASQALAFMNSPFVRGQAGLLAQRVAGADLNQSIEAAYRTALGRRPTAEEASRAVRFIEKSAASRPGDKTAASTALADFCLVLLCSNEFLYID